MQKVQSGSDKRLQRGVREELPEDWESTAVGLKETTRMVFDVSTDRGTWTRRPGSRMKKFRNVFKENVRQSDEVHKSTGRQGVPEKRGQWQRKCIIVSCMLRWRLSVKDYFEELMNEKNKRTEDKRRKVIESESEGVSLVWSKLT